VYEVSFLTPKDKKEMEKEKEKEMEKEKEKEKEKRESLSAAMNSPAEMELNGLVKEIRETVMAPAQLLPGGAAEAGSGAWTGAHGNTKLRKQIAEDYLGWEFMEEDHDLTDIDIQHDALARRRSSAITVNMNIGDIQLELKKKGIELDAIESKILLEGSLRKEETLRAGAPNRNQLSLFKRKEGMGMGMGRVGIAEGIEGGIGGGAGGRKTYVPRGDRREVARPRSPMPPKERKENGLRTPIGAGAGAGLRLGGASPGVAGRRSVGASPMGMGGARTIGAGAGAGAGTGAGAGAGAKGRTIRGDGMAERRNRANTSNF